MLAVGTSGSWFWMLSIRAFRQSNWVTNITTRPSLMITALLISVIGSLAPLIIVLGLHMLSSGIPMMIVKHLV
jgi:hypothetical protein